jgi:hypothetical protein
MNASPTLNLPEMISRKIVNLTEYSHSHYMDLNASLPWSDGMDKRLLPKRPESCWIYGTPAWDALSPAQRHQLAWVENARDVSMFIWLEQTLPPLYMGYINRQGHLLPDFLKDYLLVFSKEEIVHIQVFRRYMERAGLPLFAPPDGLHELYVDKLPGMPPVMGMLATLLVEWVAENGAQDCMAPKGVESLTRRMFMQHHREELRHISFARWVIEGLAAALPPPVLAGLRKLTETLMERLIPQFTLNPEIAARLPFDLGFTPADRASIDAVRSSAHNVRLNGERFGPIFAWLRKTRLIDPEFTISSMPPPEGRGGRRGLAGRPLIPLARAGRVPGV